MKIFSFLLVLSSLTISSLASTVNDVKVDIATISDQLNTLEDFIKAFPNTGGTMAQTLAVHEHFVTTTASVDKCTSDIEALSPMPPSERDARTTFDFIKELVDLTRGVLAAIITKRSAFQNVPGGRAAPLMKQDLADFGTSVKTLERTFFSLIPDDLVPEATTLEQAVDAAFDMAMDVYT